MEITAASLTALFTGFDVIFQRGFEKPPSYYEKIATVVRSTSRQTTYPWLGRTTKFREWLGSRVVQALETHAYTIVNKNFEDTISIDRNDIEDDNYGVYEPVIEQLGWDTKVHPDVLLFTMIKNAVNTPGSVLSYDGQPFFSSAHPVGPLAAANDVRDSTASNVNASGSGPYWFLIDASRALRPFIFQLRREYTMTRMETLTDEAVFNRREFRFGVDGRANTGVGLWQMAYASNLDLSVPANYGAARTAMRSLKTDGGLPFGALTDPNSTFLLVPPALEEVARQLLHSEFMVGTGGSASVPTTNIWKGSAQLIVSEYLA
ncbi:MAG TPA: Mu-like prophage major head subunit gpT family protein [Candidatus Binataceae bacterium]|jgi:phage major head subunit gpT-like protein|nr:Mu-like prophage major head subunit gpT family protein [Candidatus Binataceae bacterium]